MLKAEYENTRKEIFENPENWKDAFNLCVRNSLAVEEFIIRILSERNMDFAVASAGSFCRRELSPYSDIDIMFILPELTPERENLIRNAITDLWDAGIDVAHTIRTFSDIRKFLEEDLHAFTQFFETRFIYGCVDVYNQWNKQLFGLLDDKFRADLLERFFEDQKLRHEKYGDSPKVLEPNIKYSAGGLRDLHSIEWMYSFINNSIFAEQNEITYTENFIKRLKKDGTINARTAGNLLQSYKLILNARNLLHLESGRKNDRLEFLYQEKIANKIAENDSSWIPMMKKYFQAANTIFRFSKTLMKSFAAQFSEKLSDKFNIELDEDFFLQGKTINLSHQKELSLSDILRAFYYRGYYDGRFEDNLRAKVLDRVEESELNPDDDSESSVFFREILRLPKNVGKTLGALNEFGVLGVFLPDFKDLVGFFQPGVYHCYTADEHTIVAINNLEKLDKETSPIAKLYHSLKRKDLLFLSVLFHDIAKPHGISGHEIMGAEIAGSALPGLGYDSDEVDLVKFLVRHHLTMEQIAFRRNLNDPSTLNNFASIFSDRHVLDFLYLITYADLSAVSPVVWTQWKSELLHELYRKTALMLEDNISGEELLHLQTREKYEEAVEHLGESVIEHIDAINDISYLTEFSRKEIEAHADEIQKGGETSVFFNESEGFTSITVITRDYSALLSKLCGVLTINDLNIHDAKIYTRNDGIIIDNFNVTDFRSGKTVEPEKYQKIRSDMIAAVNNELHIPAEIKKVKSKWWRLESKIFRRKSRVRIVLEKHEKYTIIDVISPDRLGLLYQVTSTLNKLGMSIFFSKISTSGDDVVDAFYVLDRNHNKVSENEFELIKFELNESIEEIL